MDFESFYLNFGNLFEKTDFIFMLFKSKGSSGQKLIFSGPGARDTWQQVESFLSAIWQPLHVNNLTFGFKLETVLYFL